jgi:hypothetical protein
VDITDNVERAVLLAPVCPQPLPRDGGCLNRVGRVENIDIPKAFALESAQRVAELLCLEPDNVPPE